MDSKGDIDGAPRGVGRDDGEDSSSKLSKGGRGTGLRFAPIESLGKDLCDNGFVFGSLRKGKPSNKAGSFGGVA
jgi:hypothetical protein